MTTTYEEMMMMKEINSFEIDPFVVCDDDTGFFIPVTPVEDQTLKKVYHDMANDLLDLDQINEHLCYFKEIE